MKLEWRQDRQRAGLWDLYVDGYENLEYWVDVSKDKVEVEGPTARTEFKTFDEAKAWVEAQVMLCS